MRKQIYWLPLIAIWSGVAMLNCTAILGVSDVPDPADAQGDGTTADDSPASDGTSAETSTEASVDAGLCFNCGALTASNLGSACPGSKSLYLNVLSCLCLTVPEAGDVGSGNCDGRDAGDASTSSCNFFCSAPVTLATGLQDSKCASCTLAYCDGFATLCDKDGVDAGDSDAAD